MEKRGRKSRSLGLIRAGLVSAAVMTAGWLYGCGAQPETETEAEEKKTVITIWVQDRHDLAYQQERIRRYNETNEDHVQVEYQVFAENYTQALDNAFQNGTAPDIMGYTSQVFGSYVGQGRFAVISAYWDEDFAEIFRPVMQEDVNVIDGKCYYIPTRASISRLFYNRDIFERVGIEHPPETMEELIADARAITSELSDEGIYGFAVNLKNPRSAIDRTIMKQGNTECGLKAGFDFAAGKYDFRRYQPLLESWQALLSEDCAYPNCRELDMDPLRQLFAEGKVGMYMSYAHTEISVYQSLFPTEQNWGCAELPTTRGIRVGTQNYSPQGGYLFNANTGNMKLAWKVYRDLFGNLDYLTDYSRQGLGVSVVPAVQEALLASASENPDWYPELGLLATDRIWPKTPQERYGAAVAINGPDLYDTMETILLGHAEAEAALSDLSDRYNAAYEQGIANHIGSDMQIVGFDPMEPMEKGNSDVEAFSKPEF